jgi:hypothetical protein
MNFELQEGYNKRVEFSPAVVYHIMSTWTEVKVTRAMAEQMVPEETKYRPSTGFPRIRQWADDNIHSRWASHIHLFYFEEPTDAFVFKLRFG